MQAAYIPNAGHRVCPPSPPPTPRHSIPVMTLVQQAIHHLSRRRRQDALDAILAIGDAMHDIFAKTGAVAADLRQVNRLFLGVVQQSLYGASPRADRIINSLLLLSIRRCDALRQAQLQAAQPAGPDAVGWLSSAHASELNDHLELYRNVLAYIASHPASRAGAGSSPGSGSQTQDPRLQAAQQTLQRLCPRINNLSRWTYTAPTPAPRASQSAGVRKPDPRHRHRHRPRAAPAKPATRAVAGPRAPLPTPPTQTGDVEGRAAAAPAAAELPDTQPPAPVSKGKRGCYGGTVERRAVEGWVEEATQVLEVGERVGPVSTVEKACARARTSEVGGGFGLRPEHVPSARCCRWGVGG
ncbi:hypothetical protein MFIFM68171_06751 [Madurella fahalii]|uniref:Uncharacterized protein n=1 Tax=Madurella fahalii TaxID=1157608 RepID=A0ABQ0GFK3_9PEZI